MKAQPPLGVSLHGMTDKMQSMMTSYLRLNCQSIASVVNELDADAEIVDLDSLPSKNILAERLAMEGKKPIIALSLYDLPSGDAIHVKKPIKADDLVEAIRWARKKITANKAALIKEIQAKETSLSKKTSKANQQVATEKNGLVLIKPEQKTSTSTSDNVTELKASIKTEAKPSKNKQKIEQKVSKETASTPNSAFPSHYVEEIDRFLIELNQKTRKKQKPSFAADTRRGEIRYMLFKKVNGLIISSVFGVSQSLPVVVQAISSKGALIESKKTLKLKKKLTLKIKFDADHEFTIQATIVRKNDATTYALAFADFQHKMTEYLINSGRSFDIQNDAYTG